ncbi:hypothetical protein D3C83_120470 [compost metagenome]
MFQSLGIRTERWGGFLKRVVQLFCLAYFLGNLAIPGSVLLGYVKPHGMNHSPVQASAADATNAPRTP